MIACTQCGTEYEDFATYCNTCNVELTDDEGVTLQERNRAEAVKGIEGAVRTSVIIHKIVGWIYVLIFGLFVFIAFANASNNGFMAFIAALFLGLALLHLSIASGLKKRKPWARTLSILVAILLLFGFPIGTILGAVLLACMLRKGWDETVEAPPEAST